MSQNDQQPGRFRDFGARRPGESEYDFVHRRGDEAEARYQDHLAGIAAAKARRAAAGEPEPDSGPGYYGIGGHMSASEYAADGYRISGRSRR